MYIFHKNFEFIRIHCSFSNLTLAQCRVYCCTFWQKKNVLNEIWRRKCFLIFTYFIRCKYSVCFHNGGFHWNCTNSFILYSLTKKKKKDDHSTTIYYRYITFSVHLNSKFSARRVLKCEKWEATFHIDILFNSCWNVWWKIVEKVCCMNSQFFFPHYVCRCECVYVS